MPADALKCKECSDHLSARGALRLRALLRPARGGLRAADVERRRAEAPHPGGAAHALALRGLPPAGGSRALGAADGLDAAGASADRLAERLGLGEVWVKNETANPTHSFKDRVVSVALARAQELGFQTDRLRLDRQPRQRRRRARRRRRAARLRASSRPTSRRQKILATGAYGANVVGIKRQLRRRQPPLHRARRRARRLGVRQRQRAPVLRRGLQDARLRGRRAARLGAPGPRRRADRLRLAVHEGRARRSRSGSTAACSRASCRA